MKILHIWDQAGVACILAKHHRRLGNEVHIMKRAGYDPFGIFEFYGETLLDADGKSFLNAALKKAEEYDVVHVHSLFKIVPELKRKYGRKKLVLHYHGSEARKQTKEQIQKQAEEMCDVVIGSTRDLEQFTNSKMIYVPNPIDTEHFSHSGSHHSRDGKAFTFKTTGSDIAWVMRHLAENGIGVSVDVLDRQASPIPYSDMPGVISRYDVYVDMKYIQNTLLQALSKTALECLACGLRVLDHKLDYVEMLPSEHQPGKVAQDILQIYDKL
jgi:hypothetical protein